MTTMAPERIEPVFLQAARGGPWREALAGRPVTVVGLARSGVAACRLLRALGARVTGTDAAGPTPSAGGAGARRARASGSSWAATRRTHSRRPSWSW